jgi:hypothetical protein
MDIAIAHFGAGSVSQSAESVQEPVVAEFLTIWVDRFRARWINPMAGRVDRARL